MRLLTGTWSFSDYLRKSLSVPERVDCEPSVSSGYVEMRYWRIQEVSIITA